jgi:hypothetical protein
MTCLLLDYYYYFVYWGYNYTSLIYEAKIVGLRLIEGEYLDNLLL